jgi:hypothetical protein
MSRRLRTGNGAESGMTQPETCRPTTTLYQHPSGATNHLGYRSFLTHLLSFVLAEYKYTD